MEQRRISTRAIIWKNGKILAVKHKSKDGSEADYWATPGGGLDPLESIQQGVIRELKEETGVDARIGRLLFVQQFPASSPKLREFLEFFYLIENPEDFSTIELSQTTHGAEEIARVEFIDPATEYILPEFLSQIDVQQYIETVQPVYLFNELDPGSPEA